MTEPVCLGEVSHWRREGAQQGEYREGVGSEQVGHGHREGEAGQPASSGLHTLPSHWAVSHTLGGTEEQQHSHQSSHQVRTQVRSGQVRSGQVRSGQVRSDQIR